ncbi:PGAP1-like protein-domain-containing protein [Globomyces pollinis-pini]|nr:PGAP1-like protein-domain-containing protein [Globomyces pollinis-pini]
MVNTIPSHFSFRFFVYPLLSCLLLGVSIWSFLNYGKDLKLCDGNYIRPFYQNQNLTLNSPMNEARLLDKRYTLYRMKEDNKEFYGVPILFLPGNAGNYKQIRSFGAVAYRLWIWRNQQVPPLDIYAMETRDELGAFNADALSDQAYFANEAIKYILNIYKQRNTSQITQVLVIGHSMGGIVARHLFTLPNYTPHSILNIITLSSPHKEPPINFYRSMMSFYSDLNGFWRDEHRVNGILENVTIVAIAGGTRDVVLDSSLTQIYNVLNPELSFHAYGTGLPRVWSSMDHEGPVWCEQLLSAIANTAFNLNAPDVTTVQSRMKILKRDFLYDFGSDSGFSTIIPWHEVLVRVDKNFLTIPELSTGVKEYRNHQIPLPPLHQRQLFHIRVLSNIHPSRLYILGCVDEDALKQLRCDTMNHLTKFLPESTDEPFEIEYKSPQSVPGVVRPHWISLDVPFDKYMNMGSLIIQVSPGTKGFLFADIKVHKVTVRYLDTWTRFFIPVTEFIEVRSVKTSIKYPDVRDSVLKYRFQVQLLKDEVPMIKPLIIQRVANEEKVLQNGGLVTFYPDEGCPGFEGLEFDIWTDPIISGLHVTLQIDYLGSLAALAGKFRNMWIVLISCVVMIAMTLVCDLTVADSINMVFTQLSDLLPYMLVITVAFYLYSFVYPESTLLIGAHGFHVLSLLYVMASCSIGIFSVVYGTQYYMVTGVSFVIRQRLKFVKSSLFRSILFVLVSILVWLIPNAIISLLLYCYSALLCVVGAHHRTSIEPSKKQLIGLQLHFLAIAFELPQLLQFIQNIQQHVPDLSAKGISLSIVIEFAYAVFLMPVIASSKLHRSVKAITCSLSLLLIFVGWKHTYLVIDVLHAFMVILIIGCRVSKSQPTETLMFKRD